MGEIRKDYVLNRFAIISDKRGQRPHELKRLQSRATNTLTKNVCNFCPGNEHLTTKEIIRIEKSKKSSKWLMRVIPNKFPALELQGKSAITTDNNFYTYSDNYGVHELIVETNDHKQQMYDYEKEYLVQLLQLYKARIIALSQVKNIQYVQVIKNQGRDAGASIEHAHSQIFAYNLVPTLIQQKEQACAERCVYCSIIENEKKSYRRCFENASFTAFTPYASRFAYELWLFSKQHKLSLVDFNDQELADLAAMLQQILAKLKELGADFNFYFQNGIRNMHFHLEFTPRINIFAGFELATDTVINIVYPEEAAKWYRGGT